MAEHRTLNRGETHILARAFLGGGGGKGRGEGGGISRNVHAGMTIEKGGKKKKEARPWLYESYTGREKKKKKEGNPGLVGGGAQPG